jgi:hypothetical protein
MYITFSTLTPTGLTRGLDFRPVAVFTESNDCPAYVPVTRIALICGYAVGDRSAAFWQSMGAGEKF